MTQLRKMKLSPEGIRHTARVAARAYITARTQSEAAEAVLLLRMCAACDPTINLSSFDKNFPSSMFKDELTWPPTTTTPPPPPPRSDPFGASTVTTPSGYTLQAKGLENPNRTKPPLRTASRKTPLKSLKKYFDEHRAATKTSSSSPNDPTSKGE